MQNPCVRSNVPIVSTRVIFVTVMIPWLIKHRTRIQKTRVQSSEESVLFVSCFNVEWWGFRVKVWTYFFSDAYIGIKVYPVYQIWFFNSISIYIYIFDAFNFWSKRSPTVPHHTKHGLSTLMSNNMLYAQRVPTLITSNQQTVPVRQTLTGQSPKWRGKKWCQLLCSGSAW